MAAGDVSSARRVELALWLLVAMGAVFLLRAAASLCIPIVLAVLISYAVEPAVAWLARHRVPRGVGAGGVLVMVVGLGAWGLDRVRDDAAQALDTLPRAVERLRDLTETFADDDVARDQGRAAAGSSGPISLASRVPVGSWAQQLTGSIVALAGNATVIVFLVYFLLASSGQVRSRIVEVAGERHARGDQTAAIIDDINTQIQRFLLVRLVTALLVAVATWAALAWLGAGQAAVWGAMAGIFNSIPYFGPVIVSGGLLVVGLVQTGSLTAALPMSAAALVITTLEGWLITPPLLGRTARMHVVVVFLGLLVWTWLWQAWGTILAVPMLVVVKAIADHVEAFRPASRLMAP